MNDQTTAAEPAAAAVTVPEAVATPALGEPGARPGGRRAALAPVAL
ncbi:EamA family transporter, partial [Streptomyces sp. SID9124]|nr:EamA family transporter [Streptomyces sp. SID9124]